MEECVCGGGGVIFGREFCVSEELSIFSSLCLRGTNSAHSVLLFLPPPLSLSLSLSLRLEWEVMLAASPPLLR